MNVFWWQIRNDAQIQARGVPNPFLAKPLVNVRIPVNMTFSPLIHLYNPFASALQVSPSAQSRWFR